jgi:hypothetical protein
MQLEGLADNINVIDYRIDKQGAVKKMMNLAAFRYSPDALKPTFWMSSSEFSALLMTDVLETTTYRMNDPYFYSRLRERPLNVIAEEKNFAFYHLNGPHTPYTMNEDAQEALPDQTSRIQQTKGSFKIVYEFLDQLKALGLYEDSTIIILGDHGYNRLEDPEKPQPPVTGLFLKLSGESGTPLKYSGAPVSTDNFRATVIKAAGGEHATYGVALEDVREDAAVTRKFYWHLTPQMGGPVIHEYDIKGDVNNLADWRYVRDIETKYWYY